MPALDKKFLDLPIVGHIDGSVLDFRVDEWNAMPGKNIGVDYTMVSLPHTWSGSVGKLTLQDIVQFHWWEHMPVNFHLFGRSAGAYPEIYFVVTESRLRRLWLPFWYRCRAVARLFNNRILFTLQIWGLLETEAGAYPQWSDLKLLKRFRHDTAE